MRNAVFPVVAVVLLFGTPSVHANPAPNNPAKEPARGVAQKVALDMTVVESTGTTLAERKLNVAVGGSETVTVTGRQGRTVSIEATLDAGAKAGCYKLGVVVRDRRIDTSGHFNKTVWESTTEPCDSQPITLGPKEETRLRISLRTGG